MPMLNSFPREENFVTSRGSKFLRVNLSERLLLVSAAIRRGYTLSPLRLQDYKRDYHLLQRNASMLESIFVTTGKEIEVLCITEIGGPHGKDISAAEALAGQHSIGRIGNFVYPLGVRGDVLGDLVSQVIVGIVVVAHDLL